MDAGGVFPQNSSALMAGCPEGAGADSEAAAIWPVVMMSMTTRKAMDDRVRTGGEYLILPIEMLTLNCSLAKLPRKSYRNASSRHE